MKKLALLCVVGFALAGCSGEGISGLSGNSPFFGEYSGPFSAAVNDANYTGTVDDMVIRPDGSVDATVHSNQVGNGTMIGTINDNGHFVGNTDYPSQPAEYPTNGNLGYDSRGHLVGDLFVEINGQSSRVSFNLTPFNGKKGKR